METRHEYNINGADILLTVSNDNTKHENLLYGLFCRLKELPEETLAALMAITDLMSVITNDIDKEMSHPMLANLKKEVAGDGFATEALRRSIMVMLLNRFASATQKKHDMLQPDESLADLRHLLGLSAATSILAASTMVSGITIEYDDYTQPAQA